jgi:hypothetical protein
MSREVRQPTNQRHARTQKRRSAALRPILGGATGRHHRPPRFTGFRRLEGHPPVRLAVGPSGKAPLAAEMEIRVLGIADRPPAVMLLEGGYRLVLLLLGHDTLFLHAHGARQDWLLQVGSCPPYGNGLCALQYARRLQPCTHRAPRESVATRTCRRTVPGNCWPCIKCRTI